MRITALALAALTLLPVASFAAQSDWPAGARAKFVSDCQAQASQKTSAANAKSHCECSAKVIDEKFSASEIQALNSPQGPDDKLKYKLMNEVAVCKTAAH